MYKLVIIMCIGICLAFLGCDSKQTGSSSENTPLNENPEESGLIDKPIEPNQENSTPSKPEVEQTTSSIVLTEDEKLLTEKINIFNLLDNPTEIQQAFITFTRLKQLNIKDVITNQ